jgi:hypothetical protein
MVLLQEEPDEFLKREQANAKKGMKGVYINEEGNVVFSGKVTPKMERVANMLVNETHLVSKTIKRLQQKLKDKKNKSTPKIIAV